MFEISGFIDVSGFAFAWAAIVLESVLVWIDDMVDFIPAWGVGILDFLLVWIVVMIDFVLA